MVLYDVLCSDVQTHKSEPIKQPAVNASRQQLWDTRSLAMTDSAAPSRKDLGKAVGNLVASFSNDNEPRSAALPKRLMGASLGLSPSTTGFKKAMGRIQQALPSNVQRSVKDCQEELKTMCEIHGKRADIEDLLCPCPVETVNAA